MLYSATVTVCCHVHSDTKVLVDSLYPNRGWQEQCVVIKVGESPYDLTLFFSPEGAERLATMIWSYLQDRQITSVVITKDVEAPLPECTGKEVFHASI